MLRELKKINQLLNEAHTLYEKLSREERQYIQEIHSEHYSLEHCLRWGSQATNEVVISLEEALRSGTILQVRVLKNQIFYNELTGWFVVELDGGDNRGFEDDKTSDWEEFDNFTEAVKYAECSV